jgi:monoterpene epsilon-lactone hydrolase
MAVQEVGMSWSSRFMKSLLWMSGLKRLFGHEKSMRHFVDHVRPTHEPKPSLKVRALCHVNQYELGGRPVYHLQPKEGKAVKHVLYLHGGAYVGVIVRLHWDFLARLVQAEPCQVTVPLYGLAPEHKFDEGFRLLKQVYKKLLQENRAEDIIFMGDSAGGGMSLAFAQLLLDEGLPQPGGVVMLSPWLDITSSNPAIAEVEKRDPVLAIEGAKEAAEMWAGGADMSQPLLSPINGPIKGLAPMCLLIGTDDVLLPDCRLWRDKARAEGQPMRYLEYDSMFHTWMLVPLPESNRAVQDIVDFIQTRT